MPNTLEQTAADAQERHFTQFQEEGYTVFEQVHPPSLIDAWKAELEKLQTGVVNLPGRPDWWFGNMLEYSPHLMLPAVTNPIIWDFAERVLGPFVQLDNLTLAGFPSSDDPDAQSRVSGWHRDRWAEVPRCEAYHRPLAVNAICYLQDMTPELGPLRVIPGSHRKPLKMEPEQRNLPHPDEIIVPLKAGDVVVTHGGVVHSGTPNVSGQTRYFFSVFYNLTWLKHTDNHSGPNVQELARQARERNDHRFLRLVGIDDHLEARANSGFLEPDEERWAQWIEQDRAAIRTTT